MFVSLIIGAFVTLAWWFFYTTDRMHKKEWADEKLCFKELSHIAETSTQEKAKWIQNAIIAERGALGGSRYCRTLELVQELDSGEYYNRKGE